MSEVWLTHPNLTPAHDIKVLRAAVGSWAGSGWQVREDQDDPALELAEDPMPEPMKPEPEPDPDPEPDVEPQPDTDTPPAAQPVPKLDRATSKKGD